MGIVVDTPFGAGDGDFTIALWMKPTSGSFDGNWHGFIGYQQGTRSPSMWVNHAGTDGIFAVDNYVHLVWASTAKQDHTFFKNGQAVANRPAPPIGVDLHDKYVIGGVQDENGGGQFHGVVDEVSFYDYVVGNTDVVAAFRG